MMEKLWQVMGKLKEAPKEKRFNDTWTENTITLMDKNQCQQITKEYITS